MTLNIGETAPNFVARTTQGDIEFHQWMGNSWALLFSHPGDFTPVCTTEVGCVSRLQQAFEKRNVKTLGLSTDSLESHYAWIDDINETQHVDMFVPIIADPERRIATLYEMIHPHESVTSTIRSVYIIDPRKRIRLCMTFPVEVGRNFEEILRVIDALKLADKNHVVTPADWHSGDPVIISPAVDNAMARLLFPRGWREVRPYLRYTAAQM